MVGHGHMAIHNQVELRFWFGGVTVTREHIICDSLSPYEVVRTSCLSDRLFYHSWGSTQQNNDGLLHSADYSRSCTEDRHEGLPLFYDDALVLLLVLDV